MGARERSSDDGFTILELLVVAIIIGILAAIAITVFLVQRDKAFKSVAKSAIRNTVTYAEIVREDGATYTADISAYEAEAPPSYTFTDGASDDPQELSLAAFDEGSVEENGEVLVIAAEARGTCFYVRLSTTGPSDIRGHRTEGDCVAAELENADENGW